MSIFFYLWFLHKESDMEKTTLLYESFVFGRRLLELDI